MRVLFLRAGVLMCLAAIAGAQQTATTGGGTPSPAASGAPAAATPATPTASVAAPAAATAPAAASNPAASAAPAPSGSSGCTIVWPNPPIAFTAAQTAASITLTATAGTPSGTSGGPSAAGGGAANSSPSAGGTTASPNAGGGNTSGSSASFTIPGATVSVSVAPSSASGDGKPSPSDIQPISISLNTLAPKEHANNAADIASQLSGAIPQVVSIIAVSDSDLVFLVDVSKKKDASAPNINDIQAAIVKLVQPLAHYRVPVAGASAGKPTQVYVLPLDLGTFTPTATAPPFYKPGANHPPFRYNNAAEIATALTGWPQVISVTAISDSRLVFILDISPKSGGNAPQDPGPLVDAVKRAVSQLQTFKFPLGAHWICVHVDPEKGNPADIATKLAANSIPGVLSIIPVGGSELLFLLDATPDPRFPARPHDLLALTQEINDAVADIEAQSFPTFYLEPFPAGTGKNCDVANALVRQVPGVIGIAAVGTTRLAFTLDPHIKDKERQALERRIDKLVNGLAEPVIPLQPNTRTHVQQLYYDHDPATLAGIITTAYPEVRASAIVPDKIVLSETLPANFDPRQKRDPLDGAQRLVSTLDQPRAQLSLEAWSFQVSATKRPDVDAVSKIIQDIAFDYNQVISNSLEAGRTRLIGFVKALKDEKPEDADTLFRDYLRDQVFAPRDSQGSQCCKISNRLDLTNPRADNLKLYALGYRKLFEFTSPNLIYMLVTLAATKQPGDYADKVIDCIENPASATPESDCATTSAAQKTDSTSPQTTGSQPKSNMALKTCREKDRIGYGEVAPAGSEKGSFSTPTGLQLECVREVLDHRLFAKGSSTLGAFRAAVADFLYQYKLLVLYPDTIHPYLASRASAALDSQLGPLASAFSDDLQVFEDHLVRDFERRPISPPDEPSGKKSSDEENADHCANGIVNCKGISYAASGIVSFKTVTGIQSNVQTQTQNYFEATPPVTLGDLAAAIRSMGSPTATSTGTVVAPALPPFLTKSMTANEAVGTLAALQVLNRAPVVAKIGKGLNLQAEAYSSPGASGAELDITVTSNENGAGQVTAPTASNEVSVQAVSDDLASRVAQHQVTTRVRVGSLNLFNVSTMESVLARGKAPWKPIDPFFEVPVLAEVVKKPRKPDLIYHRSFIFINALLVPTAIDLGWGVTIEPDLVQEAMGTNLYRPADSLADLFGAKEKEDEAWRKEKENEAWEVDGYHKLMLAHFKEDRIGDDGVVTNGDKEFVPSLDHVIRIDQSSNPDEGTHGTVVTGDLTVSSSSQKPK